jgi:hypothetical protein
MQSDTALVNLRVQNFSGPALPQSVFLVGLGGIVLIAMVDLLRRAPQIRRHFE